MIYFLGPVKGSFSSSLGQSLKYHSL